MTNAGRRRAMRNVVNVPNVMTMARIAAAPVLGYLLLGRPDADVVRWGALGVFGAAMITDYFDGYIARKMNLITPFGQLADPIADKALVGTALVSLSWLGEVPWTITVLICAREVGVTVARLLVAHAQVHAAGWMGKLKTVAQTAGLVVLISPLAVDPGPWRATGNAVLGAAAVLTVVSGAQVLSQLVRAHRERGRSVGARS